MAHIDSSKDILIAIPSGQLQKLIDLAIQQEITVKIVDDSNSHVVRRMLCDIEYESSNEEWDDSGCEY